MRCASLLGDKTRDPARTCRQCLNVDRWLHRSQALLAHDIRQSVVQSFFSPIVFGACTGGRKLYHSKSQVSCCYCRHFLFCVARYEPRHKVAVPVDHVRNVSDSG